MTFTWNAGVGATAYQLTVGSAPGACDIYPGNCPGGTTTAQSATVTLPSTQTIVYVTLSSLCGGVWQPGPTTSFPIAPTSPTGPFPDAAYVPGLSYSVPNDGTPTTLTFCLAGPATNFISCDATDFGSVSPYLQGCSVFDSGFNPVSSVNLMSINPYDPNYPAAFDVTLSVAQAVPGTYNVGCTFWPAEPANADVWWQIQIVDGPPVITYFQEYPPNPDGSFYVTLWGHNFGPDQGSIQVCIQSGCSSGSMNVCPSASCGNAYYLWSDQQVNALIEPDGAPDGTYNGTLCSYGLLGTSSCLYVVWPFPFPASNTPTAAISQNGVIISGKPPQTVLVGQQIALNGSSTIGSTVNQGWSVSGGTYVGGYYVTTAGYNPSMGCLVDANAPDPTACVQQGARVISSGQNLTIYFTPPTSGQVTVTYMVFGFGGLTSVAAASATFNVVGPGGQPFAGFADGLGNNGVVVDTASNLGPTVGVLQYGQPAAGSPGMLFGFNAPGYLPVIQPDEYANLPNPPNITAPPGFANFPGTLGFLQVVSSQSATAYAQNGSPLTPPQKTPAGIVQCLDVQSVQNTPYPYYPPSPPGTNLANDAPYYQLVAINGQSINQTYPGAASFGAGGSYNMYLMFQPNSTQYPNSIPVPLAVIPWSWSGGATNDAGNWALTFNAGQAAPMGSIPAAVTSGAFPVWQSSCAFQWQQQQ